MLLLFPNNLPCNRFCFACSLAHRSSVPQFKFLAQAVSGREFVLDRNKTIKRDPFEIGISGGEVVRKRAVID